MKEFCRLHLLYSPHALSDHRSEAFRQKMVRYFTDNGGNSGTGGGMVSKAFPTVTKTPNIS
jgi:hypothetical protein